jgi:hypothetical protein
VLIQLHGILGRAKKVYGVPANAASDVEKFQQRASGPKNSGIAIAAPGGASRAPAETSPLGHCLGSGRKPRHEGAA